MGPTIVLLPSPLLGPTVWEPVAAELAHLRWPARVVPAPPASPRTPGEAMSHFLSTVPGDRDVVLVPHSNAGLYVPALSVQRHVVGVVFVDAGLPAEYGEVLLAPPELLARLSGKSGGDGLLPPWTKWWDEAEVAGLFPNAEIRARVEREQPRLPLSYFSARLAVPSGWDSDLPVAYLAFGDTYAEERELAASRGWPTATMPGSHLHTLVDPAAVTRELQSLLSAMGLPAPGAVQ